MDIKTKYSVGEKVFVMYQNRILNQFINKIEIEIYSPLSYNDTGKKLRYGIKIDSDKIEFFHESKLFTNKEDLIKTL